MLDQTDWTRIDRYLAGECTPDEAAEVDRWIEADPRRREVLAALKATGRAGGWHADVDRAWARARGETLGTGSAPILFPVRRAVPAWAWQAAAALVLVAGSLAVWTLHRRADSGAVVAMAEAVAPVAQRATVALPDGSRVVLAPESRLRWPVGLRGGTRAVSLEGEAYFSVAHDAGRPFVVRAGTVTTRVLGTRFVVRARADEGPVRVVVAEGRVLVRPGAAAGAELRRGDVATVLAGDRLELRHGVDVDAELDWTRGRLVFENVAVPEAFARLSRWYGVHLVAGDATLTRRRFSGTIENLPQAELVQALSLALDARVDRRADAITFYARSQPADMR